jgi:hypothetical protein
MTKTLFVIASIALIATATSAAAGGSTKGTMGYNGVARTGLSSERLGGSTKGTMGTNGVATTGLSSERLGGSTKGTGGINGVSQTGLSAAARPAQASMKVLSVTLPTEPVSR